MVSQENHDARIGKMISNISRLSDADKMYVAGITEGLVAGKTIANETNDENKTPHEKKGA